MSERWLLAVSRCGGPAAVLILLAVLLIGTSAGPCRAQITNPVFAACVDEAGGSWDTVFCYNDYGIDLYSGSWRSNLRVGAGQAWIDQNYFTLTDVTTTPADPGDVQPAGYRSIASTFTMYEPNPYGLPAGALTIEITVDSVPAMTYLGLPGDRYVVSEPWVMCQSYTITNTSGSTIDDIAFYQYYFPSPYGMYPVNDPDMISHADYVEGVSDPMGYDYDITLYGEDGWVWAYTGLSTSIPPTEYTVGHTGGYPDLPYYDPYEDRPSAIATDVLRQVENDALAGLAAYVAPSGDDPNAVGGAMKWVIGSLAPSESAAVEFLSSVAPYHAPMYPGAEPQEPQPHAKMLFTACTDGQPVGPGLFVADADFSNPVRLTWELTGEAVLPECYCPGCDVGSWSPDGTRIALSRNGKLAVLDLSTLMYHPGQTPEWLLDEYDEQVFGWGASWAPDGTRLAFGAGWGDEAGIYLIDADGTGKQLIAPTSASWSHGPVWSPDGSRIVVSDGTGDHYEARVWLIEDIDDPGGPTVRLLSSGAYNEEMPVWSPDGSRLVFTRGTMGEWGGGSGADLWVVDVTWGTTYRLTDTPDIREYPLGWSPFDGRIYFVECHHGRAGDPGHEPPHGMVAISRIGPYGTDYEVINSDPDLHPWAATWVPTGVWIDGLTALPGEAVTAKMGIADAENLAGVQAQVSYTGCCNTLSMYGIGAGDALLDWLMPEPSIGLSSASMLAYAVDPENDCISGAGHLFDLGITNDPEAQPGDMQLLTFDELLLADDWGDPTERVAYAGGVRTIPFAYLEVSQIPGPVLADPVAPVAFPVTITARDRAGQVMVGCDVSLGVAQFCDWELWPHMLLPVATPTSVALVDGVWSGEVAIAEPDAEAYLLARWEDLGGYSNTFQAIGKGDVSGDGRVSIYDVIKIANIAIGRGEWSAAEVWAADLNRDGEVDIFDVVQCANAALGDMGTLGAGRAGGAPRPPESVLVTTSVEHAKTQTVLSVALSDCAGLAGIQVELDYDTKKLAYSGVSAGELLTGASSWTVMANDLGGAVKAIAYTASAEVLSGGDGTILTLTFNQTGKGKAKVSVTSVELADVEGGEIPSQMSGGKGGGKGKAR